LYWFVDEDFVGTAKPGETLFWQPITAGEYTLRAVDDRGRADSRRLRIDVVQ
jgi:penicillin-binding protein 1C